jgi:hypothetical protein
MRKKTKYKIESQENEANSDYNFRFESNVNFLNYGQQLLDLLPGNAYIKDKNGLYLLHNKKYQDKLVKDRILSRDNKKIIGKTDYDIFSKEIANRFHQNDIKVLQNNKEFQGEELANMDEKLNQKFISFKKPLISLNGKVDGIIGFSIEYNLLKLDGEGIFLTKREIHCLVGIYYGCTAREIGDALNLSRRTIEDYYSQLKYKLLCNKLSLITLPNSLPLNSNHII